MNASVKRQKLRERAGAQRRADGRLDGGTGRWAESERTGCPSAPSSTAGEPCHGQQHVWRCVSVVCVRDGCVQQVPKRANGKLFLGRKSRVRSKWRASAHQRYSLCKWCAVCTLGFGGYVFNASQILIWAPLKLKFTCRRQSSAQSSPPDVTFLQSIRSLSQRPLPSALALYHCTRPVHSS